MYVESTRKLPGNKARLRSPRYQGYQAQCVEIYYHMYGQDVGTLNIYTVVSKYFTFTLWSADNLNVNYVW